MQRPAGRVDASGRELAGQVLSLFNDASALIIYRTGVAIAAGGAFALGTTGAQLLIALIGGIAIGSVVGWVAAQLLARLDEPTVEVIISFIVPFNGEEAVKLSVFKLPQANSTEAATALRARLDQLRRDGVIPAGINVTTTADESIYIRNSIASALHTFVLAMALVALVVLVFLREWKFTLISLSVLPVGLCVTALLTRSFGLSLNLMSIGGIIRGVTLMVDYGIVLLENMTRHWATGAVNTSS